MKKDLKAVIGLICLLAHMIILFVVATPIMHSILLESVPKMTVIGSVATWRILPFIIFDMIAMSVGFVLPLLYTKD